MDWPISWQKIKDNTSGGNAAPSPLYIKESKEISWDGQTDGMQAVDGFYRICEWLSKDQLLGAQISAVYEGREYTGTIVDQQEYVINQSSFQYPVFVMVGIGDNGELSNVMLLRSASSAVGVLQTVCMDIDFDEDGVMDVTEGTWSSLDDPENKTARLSYLKTIQSVAITDGYQEFFAKYQKPKHIKARIPFDGGSEGYTEMLSEECEGINDLIDTEGPFELEVKWRSNITTLEYPTIYKDASDGSMLFICGAFILKYTRNGSWYIKNRTL